MRTIGQDTGLVVCLRLAGGGADFVEKIKGAGKISRICGRALDH
jgi:hypothetical protein